MKYTSYTLYIAVLLSFAFGIAGCSKEKKPEARSPETEMTEVTMYKSPNCQCCSGWVEHMEENGFSVAVHPTTELAPVKDQHNVPDQLRSCHTALIDGLVVEGHVPAEAINRMLANRPDAGGLAVPGMPAGAPGTRTAKGTPYEVFLFDGQGSQSVYGTF